MVMMMMMNERMDGNNKCWNVSLYTAISLNMLIIDIEIVRIPFRYGLNFKQRCGWYEFLNFNAEGIIDSREKKRGIKIQLIEVSYEEIGFWNQATSEPQKRISDKRIGFQLSSTDILITKS